jgi:hypothetical protein
MATLWILFSGCAVTAWLIGYGMGYLKGVRDTITATVRDGDIDGDWPKNGSSVASLDVAIVYAEPIRPRQTTMDN